MYRQDFNRPLAMHLVDVDSFSFQVSTPFDSQFSSCSIDQNMSHRLRGGSEEVAAAGKGILLARSNHSDKGFVYQGSGLQSLPSFLAC